MPAPEWLTGGDPASDAELHGQVLSCKALLRSHFDRVDIEQVCVDLLAFFRRAWGLASNWPEANRCDSVLAQTMVNQPEEFMQHVRTLQKAYPREGQVIAPPTVPNTGTNAVYVRADDGRERHIPFANAPYEVPKYQEDEESYVLPHVHYVKLLGGEAEQVVSLIVLNMRTLFTPRGTTQAELIFRPAVERALETYKHLLLTLADLLRVRVTVPSHLFFVMYSAVEELLYGHLVYNRLHNVTADTLARTRRQYWAAIRKQHSRGVRDPWSAMLACEDSAAGKRPRETESGD